MAILDQSVDLAGEQINASQQADRAVAFIFMIAGEGRMRAGFGRQVRRRRCDRLDAGLLGLSGILCAEPGFPSCLHEAFTHALLGPAVAVTSRLATTIKQPSDLGVWHQSG